MADISKITLPTGSTYDIKDSVARSAIAGMVSFDYVKSTSAATTPKDVQWDNSGTTVTGTLVASSSTVGKIYLVPSTNGTNDVYDEYITVNTTGSTYIWEMLGNTDVHLSDLGDLAYKNSATGSFTPAGTVSTPTFTGTQGSVSVTGTPSGSVSISAGTGTANYTPAGTVSTPTFTGTQGSVSVTGTPSGSVSISTGSGTANYTPAGTVSTPTITVTPSTGTVNSITAVGTLPSCTLPALSTSVSDETLTLSWSAGSFSAGTLPTKGDNQTVVTGISSASSSQPTFSGTGTELKATFSGSSTTSTGSFTPSGSVSQPTFSGTGTELKATFSGSSTTSTGNFTPEGSVSQPTFSGTAGTVSVS